MPHATSDLATGPAPILHHGDCLDVLRGMPDASVDAIVTDPPYELGFMGKRWDASGIAYSVELWAECLRVLKPGGHLASFGGTRTYHRMACAIEDAGLEIRDSLTWLYGSGFPKSLDVSKAIDKAAGAEREVIGQGQYANRRPRVDADSQGLTYADDAYVRPAGQAITAPATPDAEQWQGWGTALKPAQEPIVLARRPLSGTVAANVLAHGAGALNIDGTRVAGPPEDVAIQRKRTGGVMGADDGRSIYGAGKRAPAGNDAGRWPSNVLLSHGPDCADMCQPGCPVAELDAQSGTSSSARPSRVKRTTTREPGYGMGYQEADRFDDTGGASRFFPVFRYQAKAPTKERPKVDGIAHPTVKPLALMRWLVRLVTPSGGMVLDPFAGSGTTLQAAQLEGFASIGIERDEIYLPLIAKRLGVEVEPVAPVVVPIAEPADPILAAIADAADRDALVAIWRANRDAWTDDYQAAVKDRLVEVEGAVA